MFNKIFSHRIKYIWVEIIDVLLAAYLILNGISPSISFLIITIIALINFIYGKYSNKEE